MVMRPLSTRSEDAGNPSSRREMAVTTRMSTVHSGTVLWKGHAVRASVPTVTKHFAWPSPSGYRSRSPLRHPSSSPDPLADPRRVGKALGAQNWLESRTPSLSMARWHLGGGLPAHRDQEHLGVGRAGNLVAGRGRSERAEPGAVVRRGRGEGLPLGWCPPPLVPGFRRFPGRICRCFRLWIWVSAEAVVAIRRGGRCRC
jgi:hypothetical protein